MKKLLMTVIMMMFLIFGTISAQALIKVQMDDLEGGYYGGPYHVTVLEQNPIQISFSSFDSFCLERIEYFSPGAQYYASIDDGAIQGGISGGNPDPLDIRTQKLYDYYLDNITTPNFFSAEQKAAMQLVIWRIEGELYDLTNPANYDGLLTQAIRDQANVYYNMANGLILDNNDTSLEYIQ